MTLSDLQGHTDTHLLQAISSASFRTVLQQLTKFQLTGCIAWPGQSATAELLIVAARDVVSSRDIINNFLIKLDGLCTVAGVVAVLGGVKVVVVASAAGVRERLTESGLVVEVPAFNLFAAVAHRHPVVASCIVG